MIEKYRRGGINNVLIKMDSVYKMGTGITGLDGKELVLGDPDYDKQRNANTSGTVILTPVALSKKPLYGISPGIPGYGAIRLPDADIEAPSEAIYARPRNRYKAINDIIPEVQVGDKIYVPWTAIHDKRNLVADTPDKKSFIFRVPYELIYCVVREGKVIPIGAHVLVDPLFEEMESILRPTYYQFNGPDGRPAVRPKSEWVQTKVITRHQDRTGVIAHIGLPLKGERCALEVGMKVLYKPKLQNLLDIEGKKYFILRQNQILLYQ